MNSWEKPSRLPRRAADVDAPLGWRERLVAALVAPLVFNVSLFFLFGVFFRARRGFASLLFLSPTFLVVLVVIPAIAGLALGIERFATVLGHSFYTNPAGKRDVRITIAIWAGLFACSYIISAFAA